MTRKWFLSLLGIGAAGQTKIPAQSGIDVDYVPARPKPKNGQCPVCGTLAEKYDRWDIGMMPQYQLVRCTHCNAAFWQDAEDMK